MTSDLGSKGALGKCQNWKKRLALKTKQTKINPPQLIRYLPKDSLAFNSQTI